MLLFSLLRELLIWHLVSTSLTSIYLTFIQFTLNLNFIKVSSKILLLKFTVAVRIKSGFRPFRLNTIKYRTVQQRISTRNFVYGPKN